MNRIPPHNLTMEEALLGAMLLSSTAIETAEKLLAASDFYQPSHQIIYDVMLRLWRTGVHVDPVTVADILQREGTMEAAGGPGNLVSLQANTPSTSAAKRYAETIANDACLRQVIRLCDQISDEAFMGKSDGADLVDVLKAELASVQIPTSSLPDGYSTVDEFLERPPEMHLPWAVPGLLRVGERAMIVAEEGFGKSMFAHQIALCAAQGRHPFAPGIEIPRISTLIVDVENPDERLDDGFHKIIPKLMTYQYERDQAYLWRQPAGIDLRSRADRGIFEAILYDCKPRLVVIGPLYKIFAQKSSEKEEIVVGELQRIIDAFRVRHGFAVLIEAHAPQSSNNMRELRVFGSARWRWWPETGLKFFQDADKNQHLEEPKHFKVGFWRGNRLGRAWPVGLEKAPHGLPWAAKFPNDDWKTLFTGQEKSRSQQDDSPF